MKNLACCRFSIVALISAISANVWICVRPVHASSPNIRWEIENRFRYFKKASDFRQIAQIYDELKTVRNNKPTVLQLEQALEQSVIRGKIHGSDTFNGWAASVFENTCGLEVDHRYSTCKMENGDSYLTPITANLILYADGISTGNCQWLVDDVIVDTKPCNQPATAANVKYDTSHKLGLRPSSGSEVSTQIQLKDFLLISFGDSFSAGEGNPDKPVRLVRDSYSDYINSSRGQAFPVREDLNIAQASQANRDHFFQDLAPKWSNTECHRSLYSQHTRVALQYALEHPHLSVTLLNYSCTGAQVYEGILNAWWGDDDVEDKDYDDAPQLVKALRDLCKDTRQYENTKWAINDKNDSLYDSSVANIAKCTEFVRDVDVLLLSVGGNDVGFARMISNAAVDVPTTGPLAGGRSWVYGLWRAASGPETYAQGLSQARSRIPTLYKVLDSKLHEYLGITSDKVILSAYPQIIYNENGQLCKPGNVGMDVHAIFGMNDPHIGTTSRDFVNQFYGIIKNAASDEHWLLADQHIAKDKAQNNFAEDATGMGHGLCAAGPLSSPEGTMKFPRPNPGTTPPMHWSPFQPENWRPYSPRNRWFVTPNDSFLTANYHDAAMEYVYDPVQPVYAATLSGSFHPNALGHAAIADSILIQLRQALSANED